MGTEYGFKDCPFCGQNDFEIETDTVHPDNIHMAWVTCQNGDCLAKGPDAFWFDDIKEAKDEAVILWNRRK